MASGHAAADQRLIEKDEEDRVLAMFKDDPEATQVLQGLLDGLKKNEIMTRYGLDEKEIRGRGEANPGETAGQKKRWEQGRETWQIRKITMSVWRDS